ncbi:hypothetical protein Tco_0968731 [Tanacetum coccineum]
MLVIKRFSKRKKVFRERKKTRKIRVKRFVDICEVLAKKCYTLLLSLSLLSPVLDHCPSSEADGDEGVIGFQLLTFVSGVDS